MVQVTRGGCLYMVPEYEATAEELGLAPEELAAMQQLHGQHMQQGQQQQHMMEPGGVATGMAGGMGATPDTIWPEPTAPAPARRSVRSLFLPPNVRERFQWQNALMLRHLPPDDERYKEIPAGFSSIFPLDDAALGREGHTGTFGYPSSVYKVVSEEDGMCYALRRIDNARTTHKIVLHALQKWSAVHSAGVIKLRTAFTQSSALFFLRDYHPGSETLQQRYLDKHGAWLPEPLIWSYVCQLVSALLAIHSTGIACRCVSASRILVTGHRRVRFNDAGVADVLEFESKKTVAELQHEDMLALGRVLLMLVCRAEVNPTNVNKSLDFLSQRYSPELGKFVITLISKPPPVFELCTAYSHHFLHELEQQYLHVDGANTLLARECENGRLFSLLAKMGFVNERPEHNMDTAWSETGDRYILKLFRDYVFHQVLTSFRTLAFSFF